MLRSELIRTLAQEEGLTIQDADVFVNVFFNDIFNTLKEGDRVEIRGLGTFGVKTYKSYMGRNPKTGEPVMVKGKKLPYFRVGRELKDRVSKYYSF